MAIGPLDMIFYPTTDDNYLSVLFLSINSEYELVASASTGAHLGPGGYVSFGFNVSEFLIRWFY